MRFAHTLTTDPKATANLKLEFVTLRIFPFRKNTSAFLHELRSLPDKKLRLANIELPKSEAWAKRQRGKGVFQRMIEVVSEPRFKFYVKEGRLYTMKTGVPGVWEEVASRIRDQTVAEKEEAEEAKQGGGKKRGIVVRRPVRPVRPVVRVAEGARRQTQRQVGRL
jgi:hypothetical protein